MCLGSSLRGVPIDCAYKYVSMYKIVLNAHTFVVLIFSFAKSKCSLIFFTYTCQDDDDNITRFLILAREPIIPGTDRPHKVLLSVSQCCVLSVDISTEILL